MLSIDIANCGIESASLKPRMLLESIMEWSMIDRHHLERNELVCTLSFVASHIVSSSEGKTICQIRLHIYTKKLVCSIILRTRKWYIRNWRTRQHADMAVGQVGCPNLTDALVSVSLPARALRRAKTHLAGRNPKERKIPHHITSKPHRRPSDLIPITARLSL